MNRTVYRVFGISGHYGPPRHSIDAAVRAWVDAMLQRGYRDVDLPDVWDRHRCRVMTIVPHDPDVADGARWWRVIGTGGHGGPASATRDGALDAWARAMCRIGYRDDQLGTAWVAGHCRLIAGTTRDAVLRADVSRTGGRDWWYARD